MEQCQLCDEQDDNDNLEKYHQEYNKLIQEGIEKKSIPILVNAISKYRNLINPILINVASQLIFALAEEEMNMSQED